MNNKRKLINDFFTAQSSAKSAHREDRKWNYFLIYFCYTQTYRHTQAYRLTRALQICQAYHPQKRSFTSKTRK